MAATFVPFENVLRMSHAALHGGSRAPGPGDTVLVPLCGDTPALRYFFNRGCKVVGVDIVGTALESAATEMFAADCDIEKRPIRRDVTATTEARPANVATAIPCTPAPSVPAACESGCASATVYTGGAHAAAPDFAITAKPKVVSPGDKGPELLLLACSFMDIPEAEVPTGSCEFVWDRGSMVALEPTTLRPQYIAALKRLWLKPSPSPAAKEEASRVVPSSRSGPRLQPPPKGRRVLYLNVVETPFGATVGPPFHVDAVELERWYPECAFERREVERDVSEPPYADIWVAISPHC
jgi:hypothetical protein